MSSNRPLPRRSSRDIPTSDLTQSQLLPRPPRPQPTSPTPLQQTPEPPSAPPNPTTTSTPSSPSSLSSPSPTTADLPLSLSTSTLLHSPSLPTDARTALSQIASTLDPPSHKITVRFHAIGDAPALKQKVARVSASSTFATVVKFLRKRLYADGAAAAGGNGGGNGGGEGSGNGGNRVREADGLFCYVNSVFAPGLDEGVGNLWRCFKVDDQLIVAYSRTPAFG